MTTPNLSQFAFYGQKISQQMLSTLPKVQVSRSQIVYAHLLDFGAIVLGWNVCTTLLTRAVEIFMPSEKIITAFEKTLSPSPVLFLTLMSGYLFFSFFFNQGQTWGMNIMKVRRSMDSHSLKHSLNATLGSLGLYFSLGFTLKRIETSFVTHDHLYQELMVYRDQPGMDLWEDLQTESEIYHNEQQAA